MKAFQFACEFDSSVELEHLTEQEHSGERGDVLEDVLVKHVEEHEPLVDGDADVLLEAVLVKHVEEREPLVDGDEDVLLEDESVSDIPEHVTSALAHRLPNARLIASTKPQ